VGLLLQVPRGGSWIDIVTVTMETLVGIAILAFAFQGRFLRKSNILETLLFSLGGMLLVFPQVIGGILGFARLNLTHPHIIAIGLAGAAALMQWLRPVAVNPAHR
jgi:TRAP-type uncharacterized transport system fused permease subunit